MGTFTFTALLEADLLNETTGSSIGVGDTFVMPAGATVEFVVTDDDYTLSGDYYNNEYGDDTSGQTADITVNGEQVFDDAKIYAEQYHVLLGSDGVTYYMMEIEVAGGDAPGEGDDFFTFWGWTPPEGVTLTVQSTYNVTCDWMDYTCLTGGDLIVIEPENTAPEARDDALVTDENTTVSANLLANDSDADGDSISVTAIEGGNVGEAFTVTTAKGYTGQVTVQADGTFTFDPDDNFKQLAQDEQDSFALTYTITDDPTAAVKHNLMFVLDISNSTVGTTGQDVFDGVGVGDVNGDGLADSVLDAEIAAVLAAVQSLIDQGVDPANIDVGIATFSGIAAGFASVDAETLGTFALNDGGLVAALQSIQSGGWTNYEAGLQQAEAWFASQAGDGAQNKLVFLSDGRPISGYDYATGQYITQTNADYGDEVSRIANDYGADIYAIGVGANADLEYLNDLDNTGGAERVTDAATLNVVVENAVAQPASSTATVTVTINGLNDAPDAIDDALTVNENETGSINILANDSDSDGDAITLLEIGGNQPGDSFEVTTAAGRKGTVTVEADGTLTFVPSDDFIELNAGQNDSFQLTYTITDVVMTTTETTADFEGLVAGTFVSDQIEGVTISAFKTGQDASAPNAAMIFDADNPTGGDTDLAVAGVGKLLIISEDGDSSDPDDNAGGGTFIFDFDVPTTINSLTFVDIDHAETPPMISLFDASGTLIAEVPGLFTGDGQKGDLAINTDGVSRMEITLTGSGGLNDIDFTQETMGEGLTDTATVTVTIDGLNAAPIAVNDALDVSESQGGSINILSNDSDPDGDPVEIVQVNGQAAGETISVTTASGRTGTVTYLANGELTFTPDGSFADLDQGATDTINLTYSITDGQFTSDATVTVTINGENAAPVAVNDTLTTTEDTPASINILANDSDPDGDALEIVEVNGQGPGETIKVITSEGRTGTVTYETDGTLTFTPDQSFQNLNEGESDTVTVTYSVTDGQFTDTATVTVLVNGTGNPNGQVTVTGSISASVAGQSHIVLVLDTSFNSVNVASAQAVGDLDGDLNIGTIFDGMLQKIVDLAGNLQDDDLITLIPSGYSGNADVAQSFSFTAGQINAAAGSVPALQALFKPITSTADEFDFSIDMPQGLAKAEDVLTANSAANNQVMVLTTSEHFDQSASVMAASSLMTNTGAELDILYIDAGDFVNVSNLNAIDSDLIDKDDALGAFGLETLLEPTPVSLAPVESFEVFVDGQLVSGVDVSNLTINTTNDGFDFKGDIDLNGLEGVVDIVVALDTDLDATTAAEVFTLSDAVSEADRTVMDGDTFVFDFA